MVEAVLIAQCLMHTVALVQVTHVLIAIMGIIYHGTRLVKLTANSHLVQIAYLAMIELVMSANQVDAVMTQPIPQHTIKQDIK